MLTRIVTILLLMSVSAPGDLPTARAEHTLVPDFSGTWKIDRQLSTAKAFRNLDDLIFVITQHDPVLDVKRVLREKKHRERISELTYYTDGRGEKVRRLFGGEKFDSKTNWVDGRLVSKFTATEYISTTSDFYYRDYTETWELSRDGQVLTITTDIAVRNVPYFYRNVFTPETYRKVFRKTSPV